MSDSLKYLSAYPLDLRQQVQRMIDEKSLSQFLLSKYPKTHIINNDKELRDYVMALKKRYLKKSPPLSQIIFDQKIHIVNNALGLHSYVNRAHGGKIKSKNEVRISSLFKSTPEPFLNMICVHELAHLKEKEHNKAFYQLCLHMMPNYYQLEFDVRLYLTQLELNGNIYS